MLVVREVDLEAVQVDENVAMWTIICRSTVVNCSLHVRMNLATNEM